MGVQVVENKDQGEPLTEFDLIREMGVTLARHYGHPQDVEWAVDDQNNLYMTQTRPITKIHCNISGEWVSGMRVRTPLPQHVPIVLINQIYQI